MDKLMDFFDAARIVAGTDRRIRFKKSLWRNVVFTSDAIQLTRETNNGIEYWMPTSDIRNEKAWQVEPEPEKLVDFSEAFAAALKGDLIEIEGGENWSRYEVLAGEHAMLVDQDDAKWWPSPAQIAGKWRVKPKEKPKDVFVWGKCSQAGESILYRNKECYYENISSAEWMRLKTRNLFPKPQKFKLVPVDE